MNNVSDEWDLYLQKQVIGKNVDVSFYGHK